MKISTPAQRLFTQNCELRGALETVTYRLEAFCETEEHKEEDDRSKINTRLARREIEKARQILDSYRRRPRRTKKLD